MSKFDDKKLIPMSIGSEREVFDDEDYIFELKLDGSRCLAYVDYNSVDFRNAHNMNYNFLFPELSSIFIQVKNKCILDGELIVLIDGKPDFYEIQRRTILRDPFKIKIASEKYPASYTVFDILFLEDKFINHLPLMERKKLLAQNLYENNRLAISRYIFEYGIDFYDLAKKNNLEGVVAKRKNSKYYFGKKTKEWIKIKNQTDDEFVVCGYVYNKITASLILGQYRNDALIYKGRVTVGKNSDDFILISKTKKLRSSPFDKNNYLNEDAVWIELKYVCTVQFIIKTPASKGLRQPVYKGLRMDKLPENCVD